MIGMSLQYKNLVNADDEKVKPQELLPMLWEHGVRSIELRALAPTTAPDEALRVANSVWDYGFSITVHATAKTLAGCVKEVFAPLSLVLSNMRQDELVVTVHPIDDDNAAMLVSLSDYIIENNYPVRIALENNRKMPDGTDGDSMLLVLDAVTRANRENVGICFDMGHYAWYTANFTDTPNMLPPKSFLSRVIHTHIHACVDGQTHFPLEAWSEPLSLYIEALGYKYFGVYNIELTPKRFAELWSPKEAYVLSADTLKKNYPEFPRIHDYMREHYDELFRSALEVFNKREGSFVSLIGPSSYLFSTNGYRWAMDVSFMYLYNLAKAPSRIKEYLGNIDLMLITHAHEDHLEERTVRALADTEITWVIPEFVLDDMLSYGVRRERLVVVRAGDEVRVGPLNIRVLHGRHFREDGDGIDAVGYVVSADNAPTLAFPGDVRDYGLDGEEQINADHCFAHVWLTDFALVPEKYIPKISEFADFMLSMSQRSIFLTHLYANRGAHKRWTLKHAYEAARIIFEKSPDTVVRTPKYGEIFEL